jgi:hypothetical protein
VILIALFRSPWRVDSTIFVTFSFTDIRKHQSPATPTLMPRKNKSKGGGPSSNKPQTHSQPQKKRRVGDQSHQAEDTINDSNTTTPQTLETRRKPGEIRHPLPPPPPSVPASHILLPPDADDTKLRSSHDLRTLSVHASSKIESKVRQVLSTLKVSNELRMNNDAIGKAKPVVVALTARGPAANKCISIAEIAKRELAKMGGSYWQYTGCWSRLETVEAKADGASVENSTKGDMETKLNNDEAIGESVNMDEEDEEPAFQTMDIPERNVVRNTACLVIYLSGEPVGRLKELYGEQVTETKKS